ncbi:MAG: OmpA family protein [Bryobacterales bacterium]|nr:OmpA family protein [Bryobacterales bacterium]
MPESPSAPRRSRTALIWLTTALILVAGSVFWYVSGRLRHSDERLAAVTSQIESIAGSQSQLAEQLRRAMEATEQAREQALEAGARAEDSQRAAVEASMRAAIAQTTREMAERQAELTRQELEAIRAARVAELNRMQEALAKVAPARRTADGVVIDLSDSTFRFDFDKANLRQENRELLSRLAGILLASEGYRLQVYGHTDDIGDEQYNLGLSERRAKAVRDYLVECGIPAPMVEHKGMGKSSPRVDGNSTQARAQNRRVEIGVVDTVITYAGQTP